MPAKAPRKKKTARRPSASAVRTAAAHRRQHVAQLFNRALALDPSRLDALLSIDPEAFLEFFMEEPEPRGLKVDRGVARIDIEGPLSSRGDWFFGASYEEITSEFDKAIADPGVRAIVLNIDSPGGDVHGMFDISDHIFEARSKAKPIVAVANHAALSAAYLLASAADKIVVSRTAPVGSVGIIARHVEFSEMEKNEGIAWTEIHAGTDKNQLSEHEPLDSEAKQTLQDVVDRFYAMLADAVARNRGISSDQVVATGAAVFYGSAGVDEGLADETGTLASAIDALAEQKTPTARPPIPTRRRASAGRPPQNRGQITMKHLAATLTGAIEDITTADKSREQIVSAMVEACSLDAAGVAALLDGTLEDCPAYRDLEALAGALEIKPGHLLRSALLDGWEFSANGEPNEIDPEASGDNIVDIRRRATESGRRAERDRTAGIRQACALAGCPERYGEFADSAMTPDQVGAKLLKERADDSPEEVDGRHAASPGGAPVRIDGRQIYADRSKASHI